MLLERYESPVQNSDVAKSTFQLISDHLRMLVAMVIVGHDGPGPKCRPKKGEKFTCARASTSRWWLGRSYTNIREGPIQLRNQKKRISYLTKVGISLLAIIPDKESVILVILLQEIFRIILKNLEISLPYPEEVH
jgi:hypothetical protein